jgi:FKBP-type peptidyl-prolyl cis-trans isomerase 2
MKAKKGDKVKVHYTGTLDDGETFDSSDGREPLEFELGAGHVIKGFDLGVDGMGIDEEKHIKIDAKDAYGEHDPSLQSDIPREGLPKDQEPKAGMQVMVTLPSGHQQPAVISKVTKDHITLDLNHPLAGKNLNFKLKLVGIN